MTASELTTLSCRQKLTSNELSRRRTVVKKNYLINFKLDIVTLSNFDFLFLRDFIFVIINRLITELL